MEKFVDWFESQSERQGLQIVKKLIKEEKLDWANWLLPRLMEYKDYVAYAIYATELVLPIFEKRYPDDDRPRKTIEATKVCLEDPSNENKKKVCNAADAVVFGCKSAFYAANAAVDAAIAADRDAPFGCENAANSSGYAATAKKEMLLKILQYGIKLLEGK